jgi:hypothetical protein
MRISLGAALLALVVVGCGSHASTTPVTESSDAGEAGAPKDASSLHEGAIRDHSVADRGPLDAAAISNDSQGVDASSGCSHSRECDPADWCNPATRACESRTAGDPIQFLRSSRS